MFALTAKQHEANALLASGAKHILLDGGSRSGKTFLILRAKTIRAIKAPGSRHLATRFRFNACKTSLALDTFPKMMGLCFPDLPWKMNKEDWFAELWNGSQIWFGGLDDKERTEKILGLEFASIFLNECSQISWEARNIATTRLAQQVMTKVDGMQPQLLALKMYYDCNPPSKSHWCYRVFTQKVDPENKRPLANPGDYARMQINPMDNSENLGEYMDVLKGLSARMQKRFLMGEYRDSNPNALFPEEAIDKWRVLDGKLPDLQRVVIAVDPSGSGDIDNQDNDAIGIVVAGLGTDGNAYVLEDLTVKAGPATWGKIVANAFDRHGADMVGAEVNFGGAMVKQTIMVARPRTPFQELHASRGKVVRAEPISSLVEEGKVRIVGYLRELEDELAGFTANGYLGEASPNRGDAFVWACHMLFPGVIRGERKEEREREAYRPRAGGWMSS